MVDFDGVITLLTDYLSADRLAFYGGVPEALTAFRRDVGEEKARETRAAIEALPKGLGEDLAASSGSDSLDGAELVMEIEDTLGRRGLSPQDLVDSARRSLPEPGDS